MQRFVFLLLVASVALLGAIVPVEASLSLNRETNAQHFARGLLPPNHVRQTLTTRPTGRLQVQSSDGTILGTVYNYPVYPNGINPQNDDGNPALDLFVAYQDSSIIALNASFPWPWYIGGYGQAPLLPRTSSTAQFRNVAGGSVGAAQSGIWSLDPNSGQLSASWTNVPYGNEPVTIVYDTELNLLYFTANAQAITTSTLISVNLFLTP